MDGMPQMLMGGPLPSGMPPASPRPVAPGGAAGPAPSGPPGGPSQGGMGNIMLILLSFLAGAGLDKVVGSLQKMMQPKGQGAARQHQGGVRMEAAKNPGMTIAPQMLTQMQGGQGGGGMGADPKLMMLIQSLLKPSA